VKSLFEEFSSCFSDADAVIVGSVLVRALSAAEDAGTPGDLARLEAVVADLAAGVRQGR